MRSLMQNCLLGLMIALAPAGLAFAAAPTAEQALKLSPVQPNIDYDRPSAAEMPKCKIRVEKLGKMVGWIVENPNGVILRRFIDTNGDNVVDQWSYYKDGLEVYRDIDSNFNGKADQHRWFHSAGSRWAIDQNEDGEIDYWKAISAEEASAEAIAAIAAGDVKRFARLMPTAAELKSLGLGAKQTNDIAAKIERALAEFKAMTAKQKLLGADAVWLQFSGGRPGLIPAGTNQSTKDVRVYENATAIAETGGKHAQVQLGAMVQIGDAWRLIDLPQPLSEGQAMPASMSMRNEPPAAVQNDELQKLLVELENLDRAGQEATTPSEQAKNTEQRAALLEKIAAASKNADEREMWIHQLADMLGAAVQAGVYPEGAAKLDALFNRVKNDGDKELAAYVKFRQLTAAYFQAMQAPKADFAKINADWLKTLEQFVADYPTAADAAEAMLQLAISEEFTGQEDDAKNWYAKIVKQFPNSTAAKKAAGAQIRLDSIGRTISLSGQSPAGSTVDLANYRGKVVLIQYWATWSTPAKSDMPALKELWNKYGRSFTIIGVNLDNNVQNLNAYLADNPLPWPQIFEEGGLDSRPANALGILTVPTMILVDQQGKVVNRNVSIAELEAELKKLIK
jgi:TolA-binding protein